ncbi:MFS transporter [Candidatus Gracilibacteria bacterium]|nr:MFS transporter [Candidatus Gracilibacteria bacterium]
MNKSLFLVLITAFLDILGMSILLPVLPDITTHFHQSESWTMWTQSVYAVGMFFSGIFIGNLSDKFGRRRMLIITTGINILGYIATLISLSVGSTAGLIGFAIFLGARIIAGIGGAGFGVVQAYISDISSPETKTKNMGMMGAAFGTAFLIGPAIGGIIATGLGIPDKIATGLGIPNYIINILNHGWGTTGILYVSIMIITINLLWIIFRLPEPKHHLTEMPNVNLKEWSMTSEIYVLLFLSLGITIGFSVIQSGSGQFYTDKFGFDANLRGYTMAIVGLVSIIFQGFLVKYVRRYLNEERMLQVGLIILSIGMILLASNEYAILVFYIIILFPLGMGSIGPSLASMLSKDAGKHAGRIMGMNTSITGIGGIIGPILTGGLYKFSITLPFWASSGLFLILFMVSIFFIGKNHWRGSIFTNID